jgi:putative acetyltransferase
MQPPILDQERADEQCLGGQALIQAVRWAEAPGDRPAMTALLESCFPTPAEARLVMALRQAGRLTVSLVATDQGQIVGHVAFSPVSTAAGPTGVALAPLAVASTHRRQGIGAVLVRAGLDVASQMGHTWAVVLGKPGYYGRFGFQPASAFGLADSYGGGEAFQVIELQPRGIPVGTGLVSFAPEFSLVA